MFYPKLFKIHSRVGTRLIPACFQVLVFALIAQGIFLVAAGQSAEQTPQGVSQPSATKPNTSSKPKAKKKYTLRITKEEVTGISLKAYKAQLSEIAADLAKQLGAKVVLGPSMEKEAITVEFIDLTLDTAVRLLAPRVYVDYEIRANAQPKPLGIFLFGYNDPEPATNAVVQGSSQAMLIEGNTEDTEEKVEVDRDEPLQIELDDNYLTIKSKQQPLVLVVLEIAELLGVTAEVKYESPEIINTEIKNTPLEDAIPRLSPNIRLYVRADLTRSKRTPLRLSILQPMPKAVGQ